jgi:hypothetical protein
LKLIPKGLSRFPPVNFYKFRKHGLADLVAKGALVCESERRYARYHLSVPLRPTPDVTLNERGELAEK